MARLLIAAALTALVACSQASATLTVEKLGTDYYKLSWSGTRPEEILPDLCRQIGAQSFGPVTGEAKPVDVRDWLAVTSTAAWCVGGRWYRDCRYIGKVTVFPPFPLSALRHAQEMTAAQLALTLTPAQMDTNAAEGGVPYQALSDEQKELARYLVSMEAVKKTQFPEPELSKRLSQSRVILAFHPFISFNYETGSTSCGSGFYLDNEARAALYRRWAPGQAEAGKMAISAKTTPGPDVPGGSTEWELNGVYLLADIIKLIADSTDIPVLAPKDARRKQICACCRMTAAALARACAIATGKSWRMEQGKWTLRSDEVSDFLAHYASGKNSSDYFSEYQRLQRELAPLARSGMCVYIADEEWTDPQLFLTMRDKKPVSYSELSKDQQAYLEKARQGHVESHRRRKLECRMPELYDLDMHWDPNLKLYIATDDAILYSEWLDYDLPDGKR